MSKNKIGPYILIVTLLLIFFFILGVRLGQRVEKTNKAINVILSITPTPKSSLTQIPNPLSFISYNNKSCGISFLYPKNNESFIINCVKPKDFSELLKDNNVATTEVTFKDKKLIVKKDLKKGNNFLIFNIKNPKNGKVILVEIIENLYPLFEETLQFSL